MRLPPQNVAAARSYRAATEPAKAGIVHFGVGNFHRAHQAVYLDDLFNAGRDHDWAIVGAGVPPDDAKMRDALAGAGLAHHRGRAGSAETSAARVTGVDDRLPAADGRRGDHRALADPAIRIVSLTVTEGGYFIDPATGAFDPDHPDDRRRRGRPRRAEDRVRPDPRRPEAPAAPPASRPSP